VCEHKIKKRTVRKQQEGEEGKKGGRNEGRKELHIFENIQIKLLFIYVAILQ